MDGSYEWTASLPAWAHRELARHFTEITPYAEVVEMEISYLS